jgi:hypothetical protein
MQLALGARDTRAARQLREALLAAMMPERNPLVIEAQLA